MPEIFGFYAVVAILVIIILGFRVIRPVEVGIVERFGKFKRQTTQGLRWIIPFIDRMIKVNTTEIRLDVPKQSVITHDNLNLDIDAVVYFKIHEPQKAIYNVNNYATSIPSLAQTTLRAVIGELNFSVVNAKRYTINSKIEEELDEQTKSWGIDIIRVELQDVRPSMEVQHAMDQVVTADREKEAKITLATADKEAMMQLAESRVIEAEAEKRSSIERATGQAEAVRINAKAEADAVKLVNDAVEGSFKARAEKYRSLEVAENSLRNNTKVVLTESGINPSLILNDTDSTVVPSKK